MIIIIISLVVLFVAWKVIGGKRAAQREAEEREAAARKKAQREARLVNGEPVACPDLPPLDNTATEEMTGPNGKTYRIPKDSEYECLLGGWDPVFRLLASEHYAQRMYQDFLRYSMDEWSIRSMVDCIFFAAECYAYGTVSQTDLYQSERAMLRRREDRARALKDDGYLRSPVVPLDAEKAISYYKMLDNMLMNCQEKLKVLNDATLFRMMGAWAELGHLYGYLGNEAEARRYYDLGFRGTEKDELARLDIIHAMMAGYPRDPRPYDNMRALMLADWVQTGSAMAKMVVGVEYAGYEQLDQARLAASPEEAVKVYTEGMERGDAFCTYMLGRCAMYGYGMEADTQLGWSCLEKAAEKSSVSAASLLARLSVGYDSQANYQNVYSLILSAGEKVTV